MGLPGMRSLRMADAWSDPATVWRSRPRIGLIFVMGYAEMRLPSQEDEKPPESARPRTTPNCRTRPTTGFITTKAIAATLDRQGIRSPEVGAVARRGRTRIPAPATTG